jgi:hypothetical protein
LASLLMGGGGGEEEEEEEDEVDMGTLELPSSTKLLMVLQRFATPYSKHLLKLQVRSCACIRLQGNTATTARCKKIWEKKSSWGFATKTMETHIKCASTVVDAQGPIQSQILIPSWCLSHSQHCPLKFEGCLEPRYTVDWGRTPQPRPPASQRAQVQQQQRQAKERASSLGEHTPLGNKDRDIMFSRRQALSGLLSRRLKVARGLVSGGNRDWGQILGELPSRESRHILAAAPFPQEFFASPWAAAGLLARFAFFGTHAVSILTRRELRLSSIP